METGYIYKITCLITNKVYIGQTVKPIQKRWEAHIREALNGDNKRFHKAIREYGFDKFRVEELYKVSEKDKQELKLTLDRIEREEIQKYNSKLDGYNSTDGGERLGYVITDEVKEKIRISHLGSKNPMFGKKHSEEHKRKISESMKGHRNTLGHTLTKETRERMSRSKGCKAIIQKSLDGGIIKTWISISDIKKEFSIRVNREVLKSKISRGLPYLGYLLEIKN